MISYVTIIYHIDSVEVQKIVRMFLEENQAHLVTIQLLVGNMFIHIWTDSFLQIKMNKFSKGSCLILDSSPNSYTIMLFHIPILHRDKIFRKCTSKVFWPRKGWMKWFHWKANLYLNPFSLKRKLKRQQWHWRGSKTLRDMSKAKPV